ncbi:DSD1 family PLP-dependent enzyme [Endozoicomonas arenosclerae]|uniref:DSD1 family PLP-dependent enzyme n=1 Tax=Endozoicomonas arenosclerae TaxID=1633495 RepID=UPI000783DF18|nr:DSD1 family PLP-dependent enzyme [Endozoicomonas arenosclerae]
MLLEQLDTPALIVDLDKMEANLKKMQALADALGYALRPHTKAHKIPEFARKQIELGAQGICTAKLGEAEVMADGGQRDILITTPIAGQQKYERLVGLYQKYPDGRFIQVIDHVQQVQGIARQAKAAGVTVSLLIEVESGQQRCGVEAGPELLSLIEAINRTESVSYEGIQAYSGHLQHVKGFAARKSQAYDAVKNVFEYIVAELEPRGLAPKVVSGGGTGTFRAYAGLGYTEIQSGSYLFMDASYVAIGNAEGDSVNDEFQSALKVISTVISHPKSDRAVLDAGMKALSIDSGMPVIDCHPDVIYQSGGDEHGILHLPKGNEPFYIGQKLTLTPSHCDTTLNNFSRLYGVREGVVVDSWEIMGRGRSD